MLYPVELGVQPLQRQTKQDTDRFAARGRMLICGRGMVTDLPRVCNESGSESSWFGVLGRGVGLAVASASKLPEDRGFARTL